MIITSARVEARWRSPAPLSDADGTNDSHMGARSRPTTAVPLPRRKRATLSNVKKGLKEKKVPEALAINSPLWLVLLF
jgi:hypothetical protein